MAKGQKRHCFRCSYEWKQRTDGTPRRCANRECRSPYWQTQAYHERARPKKLEEWDLAAGDVLEIGVEDIGLEAER